MTWQKRILRRQPELSLLETKRFTKSESDEVRDSDTDQNQEAD